MDDVEYVRQFIRDIRSISGKRNLGLDTSCTRTLEAMARLHPHEYSLPLEPREPWEEVFRGMWRVAVPGGWLYWPGKREAPATFVPDLMVYAPVGRLNYDSRP